MSTQAQLNPFVPEVIADPHPIYAELRQTSPVHQVRLPNGLSAWVVTRYEDARQALNDPRLSKAREQPLVGPERLISDGDRAVITQQMLNQDPPQHTRLRRMVSAAFTARRVEALRPRVRQITDQLLAAMAGRSRLDLVDEFAFPLPIQVICELLGVPLADRDSFRAWSNTLVEGSAAADRLPDAAAFMVGYIRQLIALKKEQPDDALLSALIAIRSDGDRLTDDELSAMVFLLLIAGHETTVNLITNGAYLLLTRPGQWDRLRADPALLPAAVEEFLRLESPVKTATFRITTEPVELGGQRIPAEQIVLISLLSANRDDARFTEPDQLDFGRTDNQHLAFGHGIHYCLGAPLARLEAQVAFAGLLVRYPRMRLAVPVEQLAWRPGILLRGLTRLPVVLDG